MYSALSRLAVICDHIVYSRRCSVEKKSESVAPRAMRHIASPARKPVGERNRSASGLEVPPEPFREPSGRRGELTDFCNGGISELPRELRPQRPGELCRGRDAVCVNQAFSKRHEKTILLSLSF